MIALMDAHLHRRLHRVCSKSCAQQRRLPTKLRIWLQLFRQRQRNGSASGHSAPRTKVATKPGSFMASGSWPSGSEDLAIAELRRPQHRLIPLLGDRLLAGLHNAWLS